MKTVDIANATRPLSNYATEVRREPVLVMKKGKPLAVLSSAAGMDAESIALANNPEFVAIINRSRARHEAEGGIPVEEIRRRLGLAPRKPRRDKSRGASRK